MSTNLSENFIYERLPEAVISLDERGLIQAVCGGFQDRLEDLRSYAYKVQSFYDIGALPDGEYNVVLVDVTSATGVTYTRSLELVEGVPANGSADLLAWAAVQLSLPETSVANARYGKDLLRLVDANTLEYLAETIGAVLYQSVLLEGRETKAYQSMVSTYFPRLRIKGTSQSYEVLGRLLGFDDVAFIPLWSRLSLREPSDVGNEANAEDFSPTVEYFPRETRGPLYDPHVMADGPFYSWSGTCVPQVTDTRFYTQVVNGNNPFIKCVQAGITLNGSIQPVPTGEYVLAGGAPHAKASVTPAPGDLTFEALAPGESFNGMRVQVASQNGSQVITVEEQLSAIKYRSSYFDLALAVNIDDADVRLGTFPVRKNTDLAAGNTPAGESVAASPYRPWSAGSLAPVDAVSDWLQPSTNMSTVQSRVQALSTDRQINTDRLAEAQAQTVTAFEEVRPATRFTHNVGLGFLLKDDAQYASYEAGTVLFTTAFMNQQYTGFGVGYPAPGAYRAQFTLDQNGTLETLVSLGIPNTNIARFIAASGTVNGTYNFDTNDYWFNFANPPADGILIRAAWEPVDTESVRPSPNTQSNYQTYYFYVLDGTNAGDSTTGLFYNNLLHWDVSCKIPSLNTIDIQGTDASGRVLFPSADAGNTGVYVDLVSAQNIYGFDVGGTLTTKVGYSVQSGENYEFSFDVSGGRDTPSSNKAVRYRVIAEDDSFILDKGTTFSIWNPLFSRITETFTPAVSQNVRLFVCQEYCDVLSNGNFVDNVLLKHIASGGTLFYDTFDDSPTAYTGRIVTTGSIASEVTYQLRPEDQLDEDESGGNASLFSEMADDSGIQFGILGNGALVDLDIFDVRAETESVIYPVAEGAFVQGHTGVPYKLYAKYNTSGVSPVFVDVESAEMYSGYPSVAYSGSLKDITTLGTLVSDVTGGTDGYKELFNAGYAVYKAGVVNGVLVADPDRFNSPAHRNGLVLWLPFNEQQEDRLSVKEATTEVEAVSSGIRFSDRTSGTDVGWALTLRENASVAVTSGKPVADGASVSFWCNPDAFASGADQVLVDASIFRCVRTAGNIINVEYLDADANYISAGTIALSESAWNFVGVALSADSIMYGAGDLASAYSVSTAAVSAAIESDSLDVAVAGGASNVKVRDLRAWAEVKTADQLESIRDYSPVPTQVPYPLTQVWAVNRQAKYGLKKLPNHWLTFDTLPAWIKQGHYGHVLRYDSAGRYIGAPDFEATGLHGGAQIVAGYKLGSLVNSVDSSGTYVFSNHANSNDEDLFNSAVPHLWVAGTNSRNEHTLYRLYAEGGAASAELKVEELALARTSAEIDLTGVWAAMYAGTTYSALTDTGSIQAVALNGSLAEITVVDGVNTTVYQARYDYLDTLVRQGVKSKSVEYGGNHLTVVSDVPVIAAGWSGVATAPAYLYSSRQVVVQEANAYDSWLDQGASATAMGVTYAPDSVVSSGTLTVAMEGKKGALEFECSGSLAPGNYELELVTGNVGQVDRDWDGFNVEINLNENIIQRTLLKTSSGADFTGTEVFDLEITTPTVTDWILSLNWLNPAADTSRGTVRQFAVYGYKLTKLETKLYQLDITGAIGASPTLTELDMGVYASTTPGGWLCGVQNSGGTLITGHEGTIYPQNDTEVSKVTLNWQLTSETGNLFDDLYCAGTNVPQVLTDEGTLTLPTFGALNAL